MEEFGHLNGEEKNRYWETKLSKFNFLIGANGWGYRLCWHILTLIMLIPLLLAVKYYNLKLASNRKKRGGNIPVAYHYFMDIYPGCVYSPFIKGYELELFKKCDLNEPSLEIGIGDGYFSSLLFKLKNKKLTFGADLIYETLKSAVKYTHCENYFVMDALEIPLPDNQLGTVIMNNIMHHLPEERMSVLNEVLRVLKRGGRFIFTDNTIGWGTFTWEQLLLRKLHFYSAAETILKYKLKLFAQKLLVDDTYYDKKSNEGNFKITKKINFISKTSMYLSSIFEFLNLKQGQPTREEMIKWMSFFGLKEKIYSHIKPIIEYCSLSDRKTGEIEGYAYQFIELEKLKESYSDIECQSESISYVCPKCKKSLDKINDSLFCTFCSIKYPIVDGIPILISYHHKLKGFDSYIENKRSGKSKKYVT